MIGAGGVIPPPDGYWPEVERILRERDVLLIADEVICGFGRLGTWFGAQRYGVTPDLVTCAKGVTSGYMPLGAVIASGKVRDRSGRRARRRSGTATPTRATPTACAVALANLDIIEREGLVDRVREVEPVLAEALAPLAELPRRRPRCATSACSARSSSSRGVLGRTRRCSPPAARRDHPRAARRGAPDLAAVRGDGDELARWSPGSPTRSTRLWAPRPSARIATSYFVDGRAAARACRRSASR